MDLHAGQIRGFFDIPVDHLYSITILGSYLVEKKIEDLVIVSPDVGGIKMARAYSKMLQAPLAIVDKRRENEHTTTVMNLIGDVKGKNVVIIDDLISTGGSLVEAAAAVKRFGAKDVYASVVHPVLAGPAIERIEKSNIKEFITSDTIPIGTEKKSEKITVLSVAPLLAEAIKRIHKHTSVSSLFADASVEA
jgi:ribose-phosphate pyrophosphokinase